MDTKGRKLLRYVAGFITTAFLMGAAYTTTAMASSIGLIDTAELLDIYAEADDSSEVVGQVMDEGHVAILARDNGWVQIQAGDIVGWVSDANLIETEVSNEEAVEANQEVIAEFSEQAEETDSQTDEEESSEEEAVTEEKQTQEETAEEEAVTDEAETETAEAFAREQEIAAQVFLEAQQRAQQEAAAAALAQTQALQAQQEAARLQAEAEVRKQAILIANGITEEDLYLLANIIYCEAGCEPYIGKVAVGNVVMNRVRSDRQPDTISEVIYAKGQFSPVRNGSLARALENGSADESCYQAALEALAGSQPVGDKLYFRRVNGRSGQVIGHHVFY